MTILTATLNVQTSTPLWCCHWTL